MSRNENRRTYHTLVTGLPKDGTYTLLQWPVNLDKPAVLMSPVYIEATGVLLCKKGGDVNLSDDTVDLIMGSVPGEPGRFAVISPQDKSLRAVAKITERPLEAVDRN